METARRMLVGKLAFQACEPREFQPMHCLFLRHRICVIGIISAAVSIRACSAE